MPNLKKEKGQKAIRFLRRKTRTNARIKAAAPDFRVIIDKSNRYIKAQVLDASGFVVAYIWYAWRSINRKRITEEELKGEGHIY